MCACLRVGKGAEVLPGARRRIQSQDLRPVGVLHPHLAVDVRKGRRGEGLLSRVGLPFLRDGPGLDLAGLSVESRDAALIHQGDPKIAVTVELEIERPDGKSFLDLRNRIFGDLAGLGVDLAHEQRAEVRVPDDAVGVDDHVMGLDGLARQIVFGHDHPCGAP